MLRTGARRWRWILYVTVALVAGAAALGASSAGRATLFLVLPMRWTGEADRLTGALAIRAGQHVADIGAGDGALAVELARVVGPGGRVYATERTPEQRSRIAARAASAGALPVDVLEAPAHATNLPDACCDAVVLRHVLHHVEERPAYARELQRALRPGGRIAIVDFAPGTMWHLGSAHGVGQDATIAAFTAAGLSLERRDDAWGGGTFLLIFRTPGE